MKIVTPPKQQFRCDFCSQRRTTKEAMRKHEKQCAFNPKRVCPHCDGSGWYEFGSYTRRCHLCERAELSIWRRYPSRRAEMMPMTLAEVLKHDWRKRSGAKTVPKRPTRSL